MHAHWDEDESTGQSPRSDPPPTVATPTAAEAQ
jgi:hypothetical protein